MRQAIALGLVLLGIGPASGPAEAWKPVTHNALAEIARHDALDDGMVTIFCVDHELGRVTGTLGEYRVNPATLEALQVAPGQYRCGVIGPDGYPDILTGQQLVHVDFGRVNTDSWYNYLWREMQKPPYDTPQVRAFVLGYLTHGAGDMFAHTYVNDYTGGPFEFVMNAAMHVSLESYIERRTYLPSHVGTISGVEDFLYRTMIDARPGTELYRLLQVRNGDRSPVKQFADLRAWVDEQYRTETGLRKIFYRRWLEDIDAGLQALPAAMHEVAIALTLSPGGMDVDRAKAASREYSINHLSLMLGGPRFLPELAELAEWMNSLLPTIIPESVKEAISHLKSSFIDYLAKGATGHTLAEWKVLTVKNPESVFRQGGRPFDLREFNQVELEIDDPAETDPTDVFYYRNFAAYNTVVLSKLIYLDRSEVDRLLEDLHSRERLRVPNVVLEGYLRTLDDGNQWHDGPGMVFARDPAAFRQIFMSHAGMRIEDPVKLTDLRAESSELRRNESGAVSIHLNEIARGCGVKVYLKQEPEALALLPDSIYVPGGSDRVEFTVAGREVTEQTAVTITAERGGAERSARITVVPPPEPEVAEGNEGGNGVGTGTRGDGGVGGEPGGTGSGDPPPSPEEVIRQIGPLVSEYERIRDQAKTDCRFAEALAAHDRVIEAVNTFLGTTFPGGVPPEVQAAADRFQIERAALARAARAEERAQDLLRVAREQLLAREVEDALTSLEQAFQLRDLPSCLQQKIKALYDNIKADVQDLARRIQEAVNAANLDCDYVRALTLGEPIERESPNLTWVREEMPRIRELAARQERTEQLLESARKHAAYGDEQVQAGVMEDARNAFEDALRFANEALTEAPACARPDIESFLADLARRRESAASIQVDRSLILLIDTSGSMGSGGKIDHAKTAARMAVNELGRNVEIALIAYDGSCGQRFHPTQEFTTHKVSVLRAIDTLRPGGGTPMSDAVSYATWYMEKHGRGNSGQILLLCDGQDSCGRIREAGDTVRQSRFGIRIDAVGLGLPEGSQAEGDLGDLVRGSGTRHSANTVNELISAFRRSFLADQVKTSDPYVEGDKATFLRDMLGIALEAFRRDDVAAARATLEQAAGKVPESPAVHFNLSLAFEAEGKMVSAINSAETYLRLAPRALDAETVRSRIQQLQEQQRERPHAIFDPGDCRNLYDWGQREASRVSGGQRVLAYTIMTAAQRGDCPTAEREYERYRELYGSGD